MKKVNISFTILLITFAILANNLFAQTDTSYHGIRFQSGLSWQQILTKAKIENKSIFMDCYATWCGPCKYMDKEIFPLKEVGDYFNTHFISVKVQMNQTSKDSQSTIDWYGDVNRIQNKYSVESYPTYLFFSSDGVITHRKTGSTQNSSQFISTAEDALNPPKQYYTLIQHENDFKNDSVSMLHAFSIAAAISDKKNEIMFGKDYLKNIKNPFTKESINVLMHLLLVDSQFSNNRLKFVLNNVFRIDSLMNDQNYVESALSPMIFEKEVLPLFANENTSIDWNEIFNDLKNKYPTLGVGLFNIAENEFQNTIRFEINEACKKEILVANWDKIIKTFNNRIHEYKPLNRLLLEEEVDYYAKKELWKACENSATSLLEQYGHQLRSVDINNIAWYDLFLHSNNRKALLEAVKCMKYSIDMAGDKVDITHLDTYANLLFKLGRSKEAILIENQVIDMGVKKNLNPAALKVFTITLKKMIDGQPTWIARI